MDFYRFEIVFRDNVALVVDMVSSWAVTEGCLHLFQVNNTVTREKEHLGSYPLDNIFKYTYKKR